MTVRLQDTLNFPLDLMLSD